jgi:EmrB/QacA subfamily drug resistance transporter
MTTTNTTADRKRWAALYVLCAGMLMIVLDATIVNVALPSITTDLHFSQRNLAWVVNAYLIAFGGLLLLAGRIGDLVGQRRVFFAGLSVFTSASLACAVATTQWMLIAARFVQGVGGAMTSAVILGMIVAMFPEPRELAKAIGVYGFVASAGGSIGLLTGGVLTSAISWHWIFLINVPIGIVTGVLAVKYVAAPAPAEGRKGADVIGATLLTAGLMLGVYTIVKAAEQSTAQTLALGGVAVTLLIGFVVRQARGTNPLMPLRLFRSRTVTGANLVQGLLVVGMFGTFFLGALYLQEVRGYSPLRVGLAFLPATVVMGAMSLRLGGPITVRFGVYRTVLASLVLLVIGLLLFVRTPVDGSYLTDIMPALAVIGLGAGLGFPALTTLAMSTATPSDSGLASGLLNTIIQVGGAVGLAVLATLSSGRTAHLAAAGASHAEALNGGFHLAYVVAAALAVVAVVVAVVLLRPDHAADAGDAADTADTADTDFAPVDEEIGELVSA